jgi:nicotinate phosphoribosyltransferase
MTSAPLTKSGIDPSTSLLLTDLYQLNMMQAYAETGMTDTAVFEFFVRHLPETRGFLMAAGLQQVVDFLLEARFSETELAWLRSTGRFADWFVDQLADYRFDGDVDAMPEGTAFFANEPILRVAAPMPVAQLVETRIINFLHYETIVASKAARMMLAAPGKALVDFGLRRAHSGEAGLLAARACYLAGFSGTATVPAAMLYDIPIYGTMAHSFIQAHDSESQAFEDFARSRPDSTVFLLDTYDTEAAAIKVCDLAPKLNAAGIDTNGVRLDSGDLAAHARAVRQILDECGLHEAKIVASGGIDETELKAFTAADAPIDIFGIGTSLVTSSDAPALDCAYKLQEYAGKARRKKSEGKASWPGRKQVYRTFDANSIISHDLVTIVDDHQSPAQGAIPLLKPVLREGHLVEPLPALEKSRAYAAKNLLQLPDHLRSLETSPLPPVEISGALRKLAADVDQRGN